jgi:hypothetical protein
VDESGAIPSRHHHHHVSACSRITWGKSNRPVAGHSSETQSHPIIIKQPKRYYSMLGRRRITGLFCVRQIIFLIYYHVYNRIYIWGRVCCTNIKTVNTYFKNVNQFTTLRIAEAYSRVCSCESHLTHRASFNESNLQRKTNNRGWSQPDSTCGLHILLFNGYRAIFLCGLCNRRKAWPINYV